MILAELPPGFGKTFKQVGILLCLYPLSILSFLECEGGLFSECALIFPEKTILEQSFLT